MRKATKVRIKKNKIRRKARTLGQWVAMTKKSFPGKPLRIPRRFVKKSPSPKDFEIDWDAINASIWAKTLLL